MINQTQAIQDQTERQVAHWTLAASRLKLDDLASPEAWGHLEQYLGVSLRRHLTGVIDRLVAPGRCFDRNAACRPKPDRGGGGSPETARVPSPVSPDGNDAGLLRRRDQWANQPTQSPPFCEPVTRWHSGACRSCWIRSARPTPVALTYPDKGVGASILKAGLRLWDGGEVSPVASIKIVRHNLLRPTALIHEAGHQAAHIAGWNEELAAALSKGISARSSELAEVWASWSTEIAADAFGFAHTGFASVASLHDVLAGDLSMVFRFTPGDPHPVSYIRVLLGVETCRYFYGDGPWDSLALAWRALHPLTDAPHRTLGVWWKTRSRFCRPWCD